MVQTQRPSNKQEAKARTDFELKPQQRSSKQQGAPAKILRRITAQNHPECSKIAPKPSQNLPQIPKIRPSPPKIHPKSSPEASKSAFGDHSKYKH